MVKKNYTRKDLTYKIHQNLGFSKNFASEIVDNFFELLINKLINSKKVKISSFGTFKVMSKSERVGRNPKTKIEAKISPREVVKFKPSIFIKKKLNNK